MLCGGESCMSIQLPKINHNYGDSYRSGKPKTLRNNKKTLQTPQGGPGLPPLDPSKIKMLKDTKNKTTSPDRDLLKESTQFLDTNNIDEAVNSAKKIKSEHRKQGQFEKICTKLVDSNDPGSTKRAFEIAENIDEQQIKKCVLTTIIQHLATKIVKKENINELDLTVYLLKLDEIIDYANTLLSKKNTPQESSDVVVSTLKHIVITINESLLDDKKKDVLFENIATYFLKKSLFKLSFSTASKIPDNLSKGTKLKKIVETMSDKNKKDQALEMVEGLPDTFIKTYLKDVLEKKMYTSKDTTDMPDAISDITNEWRELTDMIDSGNSTEALKKLNQMDNGFRKNVLKELVLKKLADFLE